MTSNHNRHDRALVVRFAGDDAYPSERADAEKLVASCADCAELAADIRLLSRRAADLPAPHRPRDFRISREQAETLRGTWFQRAMRRLAAPGLGTLRPVAGAAFAIGLTMTVAGTLPMSGGAATPVDVDSARAPAQMEAASEAPRQYQPAASDAGAPGGVSAPEEGDDGEVSSTNASPMPMTSDVDDVYLRIGEPGGEAFAGEDAAPAATLSPLVYIGLLMASVALAVLLLAMLARRRFADPLLR